MKFGYLLLAATLAACASPPEIVVNASTRIAEDLALSIRHLAEAKTRYGANHPEVVRLEAAQASLTRSGHEMDAHFDSELREALKYQLALAEREQAELALRYAASHPARVQNAAVIEALAIGASKRGL